jgi:hypothetical protein
MTIRDYIATQVLAGLASHGEWKDKVVAARTAYEFADALIAESEGK